MSAYHEKAAIISRERAMQDAWLTYQSVENHLSPRRIAELAIATAHRLADGTYAVDGGLGVPLAERTIRRRLSDHRQQVVEEMIATPLLELIAEQVEALDEEAAWWAAMSRPVTTIPDPETGEPVRVAVPFRDRMNARANLLRVFESKRKLLGIDQPTKVQVQSVGANTLDDEERIALEAAEARLAAETDGPDGEAVE